MSDFDDLRQMHEAKERAEALKRQREQEKYRRQDEAARRLTEIRKANADKLNSMVVDVLEALRDALYPGLEVGRISSEWRESGVSGWGVVRAVQGLDKYGRDSHDEFVVQVHVEFDKRGEAKHFVSFKIPSGRSSQTKFIRTGLSRDDLVRALKKLHAV